MLKIDQSSILNLFLLYVYIYLLLLYFIWFWFRALSVSFFITLFLWLYIAKQSFCHPFSFLLHFFIYLYFVVWLNSVAVLFFNYFLPKDPTLLNQTAPSFLETNFFFPYQLRQKLFKLFMTLFSCFNALYPFLAGQAASERSQNSGSLVISLHRLLLFPRRDNTALEDVVCIHRCIHFFTPLF